MSENSEKPGSGKTTVGTITRDGEELDVLIVGAGISGIGAAVHLQKKCPRHTYAILEMREHLGGTWDLFKYPGIRSDSDMYTLGYRFKPWANPQAIADGPSILRYLEDTAREYGVDRRIRYGKRVVKAAFDSAEARWAVDVRDESTGEVHVIRCKFLFACTGYYRYEAGYSPEFPGRDRFEGQIIHPQLWPDDLDYTGKRVVVIGSGATAVTLVPAMAEDAAHVTMLQRSPTYVVSRPDRDPVADWLRNRVPENVAHSVNRWKNWGMQQFLFRFSRRFPDRVRKFLLDEVRKGVGPGVDVETHFGPKYDPWDERMCLIPNGDLFDAVKAGQASVVTDTIETFTERGIKLRSGEELEADLIITATGLHVQLFGGAELSVDGEVVDASKTMAYRSMMLSDVPNFAFAVGYTNASWTLKVDITCDYVCRLLNHMQEHGHDLCVPPRDPSVDEAPLMNLQSGYLERAKRKLPAAGASGPWRVFDNYARERFTLSRASVEDGVMRFASRRSSAGSRSRTDAA